MAPGATADQKAQITFGKFQNVDMRVARVVAAPMAEGTRCASRVLTLDLGPLGPRTSVAQFALIDESELVGRNVVACVNLGVRDLGPYTSECLTLGTPHPEGPDHESQAIPLYAHDKARLGDRIY
jgi:tRNA-binding protein